MPAETRASLGKRDRSLRAPSPAPSLGTPRSNKRLKSSGPSLTAIVTDGEGVSANKENVPPLLDDEDLQSTPGRTPRASRIRRTPSTRTRDGLSLPPRVTSANTSMLTFTSSSQLPVTYRMLHLMLCPHLPPHLPAPTRRTMSFRTDVSPLPGSHPRKLPHANSMLSPFPLLLAPRRLLSTFAPVLCFGRPRTPST